jgi:transcriptional regulator with XRE-family HTH domain
MEDFGPRLRELRKNYKITQADVANAIGTTTPEVSAWENGAKLPPSRARYLARATDQFTRKEAFELVLTAIVSRGKVEFDVDGDTPIARALAQLALDLNGVSAAKHAEALAGGRPSEQKVSRTSSGGAKRIVLRPKGR